MADDAKVEEITVDMDELSFDPTMKKKKSSTRKKAVAFEGLAAVEVGSEDNPSTEVGSQTLASLFSERVADGRLQ